MPTHLVSRRNKRGTDGSEPPSTPLEVDPLNPLPRPLICAGDLLLDVLITRSRLADGMPDGIYLRPGGSAAHVAAWASSEGYPSAWLGVIGADTAGDFLLADLRRSGVVAYPVQRFGLETGVVLSWIGAGGNRTMHSARWAAAAIDPSSIPLEPVQTAAAVHVTGYLALATRGIEAVETIFRAGRDRQAFLSFDPSDAGIVRTIGPQRLRGLLRRLRVDAIFANRREATALTGLMGPRQAAVSLAETVDIAVVKDGARGCYVCQSSQPGRKLRSMANIHQERTGPLGHVPAMEVNVVDTTGAGDAFAGAWLASYLREGNVTDAALRGVMAAARCVQAVGGRPAN